MRDHEAHASGLRLQGLSLFLSLPLPKPTSARPESMLGSREWVVMTVRVVGTGAMGSQR